MNYLQKSRHGCPTLLLELTMNGYFVLAKSAVHMNIRMKISDIVAVDKKNTGVFFHWVLVRNFNYKSPLKILKFFFKLCRQKWSTLISPFLFLLILQIFWLKSKRALNSDLLRNFELRERVPICCVSVPIAYILSHRKKIIRSYNLHKCIICITETFLLLQKKYR